MANRCLLLGESLAVCCQQSNLLVANIRKNSHISVIREIFYGLFTITYQCGLLGNRRWRSLASRREPYLSIRCGTRRDWCPMHRL